MKKKFSSRNALKLVSATSMTIFSLLSVFTATAAWFDSQRNLSEGANQMAVHHVQNFKALNIYAPTSDGGVNVDAGSADVIYTFDDEPVGTYTKVGQTETAVFLGGDDDPYSMLNPYHPLLLVVEYETAVASALYINLRTTEKFICPVEGDGSGVVSREIDGSEGEYPLSSVVHFSTKCYAGENAFLADQQTSSGSWSYSRNTTRGVGWTQTSFARVSGGGFSYRQQIEICGGDISGTTTFVAIMMEYDIEIISAISSYYMGEEFISTGEDLSFFCDWIMEI